MIHIFFQRAKTLSLFFGMFSLFKYYLSLINWGYCSIGANLFSIILVFFSFHSRADLSCKSCSALVTDWLCNSNTIIFQGRRLHRRVVLKLFMFPRTCEVCFVVILLNALLNFIWPFFFFLQNKNDWDKNLLFGSFCFSAYPEELVFSCQTGQRQTAEIYFYSPSKTERRRRGGGKRGTE